MSPSRRSYVYADLPRTGLGNMLLVWARALVFARLHGLPLIVAPWTQFRVGPYLRREAKKRLYWGFFKEPRPRAVSRAERLYATRLLPRLRRVEEPAFSLVPTGGTVYVFHTIPHFSDPFVGLKDHRDLVRQELFDMLAPGTRSALSGLEAPIIGLHVRLGDYRPLRPEEDFAKTGLTRTPMAHFLTVVAALRAAHGSLLPVTVFSDGRDHELSELLSLPAVTRAPPSSDIVDMLLLSRSRVVVCSAGSTFSYWSAFLSEAPVILHPDHIHRSIRSPLVGETLYEGPPTGADGALPELLARNIRDIRWNPGRST